MYERGSIAGAAAASLGSPVPVSPRSSIVADHVNGLRALNGKLQELLVRSTELNTRLFGAGPPIDGKGLNKTEGACQFGEVSLGLTDAHTLVENCLNQLSRLEAL